MPVTIVKDVELLSVGMRWRSVNGDITFTFEHLADAMKAANEDPHVVAPRLKIGHSDPRFEDPEDPGHDPFYDGEPALGSIRNLRLINDGSMLIGDYVDVPTWLAEVMPTAYPSRSIEGGYQVREGAAGEAIGDWDVETPGGKRYSFVLTACALLGLSRPAVENLDDLRNYLVAGEGVVVAGAAPAGGQPVDASIGDVPLVPEMSADVERVVDVFCADFAPSPNDEGYWWWPISMFTDSGILYLDDDEGGIRAVPYSTDADQNVSFGDPYKVIQRYEEAPAAASLAASLETSKPAVVFRSVRETPLAARHAERAATGKSGGDTGGSSGSGSVSAMPDFKQLRADLGLPDSVSDETIKSSLAAVLATGDGEGEGDEGKDDEDGDGAEGAPEGGDGGESGDGAEGDGAEGADGAEGDGEPGTGAEASTVTVDRKVFESMKEGSELGRAAHARQATEDRAAILTAAVRAGKIMPVSKADWEKKLIAAPEATKKEIEGLAEGLVPVTETGGAPAPALAASDVDVTAAAIVQQWFGHSTPKETV